MHHWQGRNLLNKTGFRAYLGVQLLWSSQKELRQPLQERLIWLVFANGKQVAEQGFISTRRAAYTMAITWVLPANILLSGNTTPRV